MNDYKTVKNKILPVLWQLLRVDATGSNQEQLVLMLRQLQSLCVFPSSHLPNKQNQIMLDNFGNLLMTIISSLLLYLLTTCTFNLCNFILGIVSDIMSFLFEKSDGRMLLKPATQGTMYMFTLNYFMMLVGESSGSVNEDVFNNCFLLLQYLSVDNMNVRTYTRTYTCTCTCVVKK